MINDNKNIKIQRLPSLDFAKGIAIILVVYGHADLKMDPTFYELHLQNIHKLIYSFHLPLFFMISAALSSRYITNCNSVEYLKKISLNMLYPFYSLSIVFAIINILIPQSFFSTPRLNQMIQAMIYMQSSNEFLPSPNLWFLFTLFLSSVVTYILVKYFKIDNFSLLIIAMLTQLAYMSFYSVDILGLRRFLYNYAFFALGYILNKNILDEKEKQPFILIGLLFICWILPFVYRDTYGMVTHFITGITGSLIVIFLCRRVKYSAENRIYKMIYICGKNSLLIFVFHMPFFVFCKKNYLYPGVVCQLFWIICHDAIRSRYSINHRYDDQS